MDIWAWFKNGLFRVTLASEFLPSKQWNFSVIVSGCGRLATSRSSDLLRLKRPQAEECEPVRMVLAGHQLGRTFTDASLNSAAQIAPMVQKKLQQIKVGRCAATTQCAGI